MNVQKFSTLRVNITVNETLDILKSLDTSKASGPDGISSRMLKETAISIAPSFTRLLQMSLSSATFPDCWKQANVLPIFKKGDKSDFDNYTYFTSEYKFESM